MTTICLTGLPQTPKYSNEFMSIGVGARALAMGNSTSASSFGNPAAYWNPAALNFMKSDMQVALMHSPYFSGLASYNYGSIAFKSGNRSALGFSLIRLAVDDIPNTLELIDADGNIRYDRIKSFSASDYGFLTTFSRRLKNENISLGGSLKIIRRTAGDFASAWGFGMDFSALIIKNKWKIAFVGKDISTTYNSWVFNSTNLQNTFIITGNSIPESSTEITLPRLIIGASREFHFFENLKLLTEINIDITTDLARNTLITADRFSFDPKFGLEFIIYDKLFIRAGVNQLQYTTIIDQAEEIVFQPTAGVGFNLGNTLTIDYALANPGAYGPSLLTHIFSLKFNIRKKSS